MAEGPDAHRADAHRVDVVQVRTPELDAARRQPQRLVDDEVGDDDEDAGVGVAKRRYRLAPVLKIAVGAALDGSDLFAVFAEAGAQTAFDDALIKNFLDGPQACYVGAAPVQTAFTPLLSPTRRASRI